MTAHRRRTALILMAGLVALLPVTVNATTDLSDRSDFEAAGRGFIASFPEGVITDATGQVVYDYGAFDFLNSEAPATVHPGLWRQGQLNARHGLFEVVEGIYQVRGFDVSNVTFIRGERGWIVVDPLITRETAERALVLVNQQLGARPVTAVVFTHSHLDHFGGVRGIVTEEQVAGGEVEIVAPAGFVREAISENLLAGNAMARRAAYMFGSLLPRSPEGQVGVGLGQAISNGVAGLIRPTIEVERTGQRLTLDGIEMEFILARDAEAPTEFMFYLPKWQAFCQAEIINRTLHNLYTPRGAKVRDGRLWSRYIDEAIVAYGDRTDVSFGSHHWPTWGADAIREFWRDQRDLYRYIHDQTLRLANQGHTLHEIPDLLQLPPGLADEFYSRGYYGTVSHNAKAQYQLYLGYFDGNPANLDPLGPVEAGRKFVEYVGGAAQVMARARADYQRGEYRYAATALNHLVFAEPDNRAASELLAEIYTQLAASSESGPWRNFYLSGASELRHGVQRLGTTRPGSPDLIRALPLDLFFDFLAVRLDGPRAAQQDREFNFEVFDTGERALLIVSNGTLHHRMGMRSDSAPSFRIASAALIALNTRQKTLPQLLQEGSASIEGDPTVVLGFFRLLEEPEFWFEIVRP